MENLREIDVMKKDKTSKEKRTKKSEETGKKSDKKAIKELKVNTQCDIIGNTIKTRGNYAL